ncbi:PKD domain-containing protein [Teredinibacter sp. KSP-S5-2]|uniref:PKD domain-containing protein n=1 Tax=Teredinibacter sp. KSP-S5-2 TaxID=3034506 RepID=UPI0029349D72|nr:PKD domain-containing protein [Teredinibacter sp. KSP-S5-2]WNO08570.1 PKD domain-containing protein [Teredinibacter sp. KSP-S5-2]
MKKKLRLNTLNAFQAGIALLVLSHVNMAGAYDCSSLEEWQSSDVYVSGDKVIREFSAYQAKWWNQSQDPLTNSKEWDVWQLVDTCSGISSSSSSSSTTTTSSTSSTGGASSTSSTGSTSSSGTASSTSSTSSTSGSSTGGSSTGGSSSGGSSGGFSHSFSNDFNGNDLCGWSDATNTAGVLTFPEGVSSSAYFGDAHVVGMCPGLSMSAGLSITYTNNSGVEKHLKVFDSGSELHNVKFPHTAGLSQTLYFSMPTGSVDLRLVSDGTSTGLEIQQMRYSGSVSCSDMNGGGGGGGPSCPTDAKPIVSFNSVDVGYINQPIVFDSVGSFDPDGTIQTFEWLFPGGISVMGQQVTHVFDTVGDYWVTLKVTDDSGNSVSRFKRIPVMESNPCLGYPVYSPGLAIAQDELVVCDGKIYRCKIAGWCSSDAAWAYSPCSGIYWDMAWDEIGVCPVTAQ